MKRSIYIAAVAMAAMISSCTDPPVASFQTDADTYMVGETVYFLNSCQNANSFNWDFDDGTASSEENPNHIFTEEGKFTVVLEASNKAGSDVARKSLYIEESYPCWTELASPDHAHLNQASVAYNNLVYEIAGHDQWVEAYDPATNEWSSRTERPVSNYFYAMNCELGDKVYCIGGLHDGVTLTEVYVYDLEADSWSEGTPLLNPRCWGSAVSCDGKIYVIGGILGFPPEIFYSSMEIYDPVTDTWTEKECPVAGWFPATAAVNGKIYSIGGFYGDVDHTSLTSVFEYDPATDHWEQKTSIPTGRWGAACVVLDDLIYVMAGGLDWHWDGDWDTDCNLVDVYNPSTDTWSSLPPMPVKRVGGAACLLNGMIYYCGGAVTVASRYDNFHVYDPTCDTGSDK